MKKQTPVDFCLAFGLLLNGIRILVERFVPNIPEWSLFLVTVLALGFMVVGIYRTGKNGFTQKFNNK